MALDPSYIVGINLGEVFVDKTTGLALSGGEIFFYEDSARSVPKTVYELSGSPANYTYEPLPNPIVLSAVGTIVNAGGTNVAVYYYPFDGLGNIQNYFIVVKSEDGTTQFEREAWPNVTPTSSPSGKTANTTQNEISNSQFVDVLFPTDTGLEISWTGALAETTYSIAPDWNLVIEASGTGSVTINRNAIGGSLNVLTNPPFVLEFIASSVNITTLKLAQRLYNNPDIWANQYVSGNMLVESLDGVSRTISMVYSPSVSVAATTILTGVTGAVDPVQLFGSVLIPFGTNSQDGDDGYIDIEIVLPNAGNYSITSIQVTSGDEEPDEAQSIEYQEQPANRQRDFSFHTYRPQIIQLAVPSLLEGWDFRVNPTQWGGNQSLAARSQYVWDQTIIYQSADNAISVNRSINQGLRLTVGATTQFALIQYIDAPTFLQLLESNFSTLLNAFTDIAGGVTGTVSFWTTTGTLPDVSAGSNLSIVATLDADGKPATFNGTWAEIPRNTGWDAKFTIPEGTDYASIPLEGWSRTADVASSSYTYGAIVVGFSETDLGFIDFQSISVTPTLIASPVAPLSYQLTLNQLQRYYEQTYPPGTVPGTATIASCFAVAQQFIYFFNGGSGGGAYDYLILADTFNIAYKTLKRVTPNFRVYNVTGTADQIQLIGLFTSNFAYTTYWFGGGSQNSPSAYLSVGHGSYMQGRIGFSGTPYHPYIQFHYTADARLGIV